MINYGKQDISTSDIDAVIDVLKSDFLTQGPVVPKFEQAIASTVQARYGVAVNSATSALHVACAALGVGPGDIVWTVPNTFVASANCGLYCGAEVGFVDIDPATWNMSVPKLEEKLILAKAKGTLPRVIIPVHFAGQPTEQDKIFALAKEYGVFVIEDASHSIGAHYQTHPVGSCKWSDISVFSFHPVKIITTGEGGMALTNSPELAKKMGQMRNHGITRDTNQLFKKNVGEWHYEQQMLGWNYRMTDIAAALGLSQLGVLKENIKKRNRLAQRYAEYLEGLPIQLPTVIPGAHSAYHLYVILVEASARHRIFNSLRQDGVGVNVHYTPVHLQPFYQQLGFQVGMFDVAEEYGQRAVTIPLYPGLTDTQQDYVVECVRNAVHE